MMPPSQPATRSPPKRGAEHDEAGDDLDAAHEVHGVLGAAGEDVVELGGEVAGPVVGQHLGELVEAEEDRRDGERDAQQQERLRGRIAAQDVRGGIGTGRTRPETALLMGILLVRWLRQAVSGRAATGLTDPRGCPAMAALKDRISPRLVADLADELARAHPAFPRERFAAAATSGLEELELLARVTHIARALGDALPEPFADAAAVLDRALDSATLTSWMTLPCNEYVATHGIDEPDIALPLLARLTPRFSSESAIRPFIERHPEVTFAHLRRWLGDPDEHVRRLVSEGTRPRLPWAPQLRSLRADPRPAIELLDHLVGDESAYVRRSVANHLNDIAKDHPELAVSTAQRWRALGADAVVRHGMRSLVKQGDARALALLGYDPEAQVALQDLTATPGRVEIGGTVELAFTLAVHKEPVPVMVDYRVHHAGARGPRSAKVFKLTTATLQPGAPRTITRRHAFREVSVRRIHPGPHLVEVQVNGRVLGGVEIQVG